MEDVLNEWSFPDLDLLMKAQQLNGAIEEARKSQLEEELERRLHLEELARQEIENLKIEYLIKIQLINNILKKVENPVSILDDEFIDIIQDLIKKAVKNIIHKEIKSNSKIMTKMIAELKSSIKSKDGMLSVSLSENDYKRLNEKENRPSMQITVNPVLQDGDVIIKSNSTEIRAILNDRIDALFKVKNE